MILERKREGERDINEERESLISCLTGHQAMTSWRLGVGLGRGVGVQWGQCRRLFGSREALERMVVVGPHLGTAGSLCFRRDPGPRARAQGGSGRSGTGWEGLSSAGSSPWALSPKGAPTGTCFSRCECSVPQSETPGCPPCCPHSARCPDTAPGGRGRESTGAPPHTQARPRGAAGTRP